MLSYINNALYFPTVPNVCNQILREIVRFPEINPKVSIAHVIMEPGNVSLLHEHKTMKEFYYILTGSGVLYHGNRALNVNRNAYLNIPEEVPHKLRNGNSRLMHLVFAMPPFNQNDVIPLDDKNYEPIPEKFVPPSLFAARDGALVYSLFSKKEQDRTGVGVAYGILEPQRKALRHKHNISDEIYYLISKEGYVKLNNEREKVLNDDIIYIPKGTEHGLENPTRKQLEILCVSCPPYDEDDFILA